MHCGLKTKFDGVGELLPNLLTTLTGTIVLNPLPLAFLKKLHKINVEPRELLDIEINITYMDTCKLCIAIEEWN